ncbi:MAG: O-antigen ligase family protein [Bryobacteraceae bacterium]
MTALQWSKVAFALIIGYGSLGKSFAYFGIPAANIFIGDVFLLLFLLLSIDIIAKTVITSTTGSADTSATIWFMLLFVCFGLLEVIRGIYLEYPVLTTIQGFAFHAYVLYFFLGWWTGSTPIAWLPRAVRALGYWNCVYAPLYLLFLNKLTIHIPGTDVLLFGQAGGATLVIIGLISFEEDLRRVWLPLSINTFLLLAQEMRSQWVGIILALLVVGFIGKRYLRVAASFGLIAGLLIVGYVTDFSMPSPSDRGGVVSTREIVGRALASIDEEAAHEYTTNSAIYAGTVSWRTRWWRAIWDASLETPAITMIGHGYGYPLHDLVPYLRGTDIRTPHNIFFFALGYGGWINVILFFGLQFALLGLLWRVWQATGQAFGLAMWVIAMVGGLFGNMFETPFGAIPYYLLIGAAAAPLRKTVIEQFTYGPSFCPQPLPTTGWRRSGV